jgi:hypothetical protein
MARAAIGIVGSTYMQLLDRTLPPLYRSWERLGYRRNRHYWVRQKPPKHLNIPLPYYAPETDKNAIYWWNGACFKLISQDRPGSANGNTLDGLYGDEAKLINKVKFDSEIDKANRGNVREFGDYAGHHGILFMTDMPTTPDAKWILQKKHDMKLELQKGNRLIKMQELINVIINYQLYVSKLQYELFKAADPVRIKQLKRLIRSGERKLNELRKETVNYTAGSSLENIHFIGLDTVKKWKRDSLDIDFQTQVLNQELYQVPDAFYPNFNPAIHTRSGDYNYGYVEAMGLYLPQGVIKDSRIDRDCRRDQPLDIGMDTGSSINCLVVAQEKPNSYHFLKDFFVKKPALINQVVEDACDYYEHHKCKIVNFYYDNTFVGTDGTRIHHQADIVTNTFIKRGWTVRQHYISAQPEHDARYRLWNEVHNGGGEGKPPVTYNRENCASLIVSIQCTGAREVIRKRDNKTVTVKDKRTEHRANVPQEEAPHLTDAMDTVYIGKYRHTLGYAIPRSGMFMSEE